MLRYKYLIIGGGMTADAAVGGIRQIDFGGSIGVIGAGVARRRTTGRRCRKTFGKANPWRLFGGKTPLVRQRFTWDAEF